MPKPPIGFRMYTTFAGYPRRYRAASRHWKIAPSHTHGYATRARAIGYQAGPRSACVIAATVPNVLSATAMIPRIAA